MRIRKKIDKRIEHDEDGVQVSGDVNAVVSINVGEDGSSTRATSRQSVVQRGGEATAEPEGRESSGSVPLTDEHGRELPNREGTYDELREAAAEAKDNEGAEDD